MVPDSMPESAGGTGVRPESWPGSEPPVSAPVSWLGLIGVTLPPSSVDAAHAARNIEIATTSPRDVTARRTPTLRMNELLVRVDLRMRPRAARVHSVASQTRCE
jgi:hypothetical protein